MTWKYILICPSVSLKNNCAVGLNWWALREKEGIYFVFLTFFFKVSFLCRIKTLPQRGFYFWTNHRKPCVWLWLTWHWSFSVWEDTDLHDKRAKNNKDKIVILPKQMFCLKHLMSIQHIATLVQLCDVKMKKKNSVYSYQQQLAFKSNIIFLFDN